MATPDNVSFQELYAQVQGALATSQGVTSQLATLARTLQPIAEAERAKASKGPGRRVLGQGDPVTTGGG